MLKADLHTHTIASTHAFHTIDEMAREAAKSGIEVLGIADHGPSMPDGPSQDYFICGAKRLARDICGVRLLFGVEANIMDRDGSLDIEERVMKMLDFVIASLHNIPDYTDQGKEGNTDAIINAMKNPYVKIIGHPYGSGKDLEVDIEKIAEAACNEDVLLEINASYFYVKDWLRDEAKTFEDIKKMISILKKARKKMIINSDAHSAYEIGRDEEAREKFGYMGLEENDIINYNMDEFKKYFNIK